MSDRCPTCDRPVATDTDWPTMDKPAATRGVCYETGCGACVAIGDWRARALAAEAVNASSIEAANRLADAAVAQERALVVAFLDEYKDPGPAWIIIQRIAERIEAGEHLAGEVKP